MKWSLAAAVVVAVSGCGFDTSATFYPDGSVNVGMRFLFPKSLLASANGSTVTGFTPADIAADNTALQAKYPGAAVTLVNVGDESGAQISIPFKTEKAAFGFLTSPSRLSSAGATSGTGLGLNLSDTGGLFTAATHTTSHGVDTYTFKTSPPPMPSPSPGQTQVISGDEVSSVFVLTFSLTVPRPITSAPGALFTLDHRTAIWKLSWTQPMTLTATTGSAAGLAASSASQGPNLLLISFAAVIAALGMILGLLVPRPASRSHEAPPEGTSL